MSITQEDIDALHQSPRSANDSDVTELCEKIAELQVSLAVSQREAADWKQELEAYKATENARISELQAEVTELRHAAGVSNQTIAALQADLAQARAEAKTNGDEAAAVRRLYGDAMVGIGELQAERDALMSCKEAASDEQIVDPQELVDRANCYEADHEFIDGHLLKLGAQEIRRLEAKVLALQSCEVDANRYRWLKTTSFGGEHDHFIIFGNDPETGDSYPLGGDELDSLIDKDMQPLPLKAPPPIIRGEINLIPDGYYSIDAQPTSEKSHQKIGTITDAQVGSGGDNQSQPQPLSGEQYPVPLGHFWRGDVDRFTCKHCGFHHCEHVHTDEASRCPSPQNTKEQS